jgi:hypothetical protein
MVDMKKVMFAISALGFLWAAVGFSFYIFMWHRHFEYNINCAKIIDNYGSPIEEPMALAAMDAQSMNDLFHALWQVMDWPESVILMIGEPNLKNNFEDNYEKIQKMTQYDNLKEKYCSGHPTYWNENEDQ